MILDPTILIWLGLATFVASVLQGATGFGFGVLVVPAFLLVLPAPTAIQATILVGGTMMTIMALRAWRDVPWPMMARFICGAVLSAPVGVWFLRQAPDELIKLMVGTTLIGFLIYIAVRRWRTRATPPATDVAAHPLREAVVGVCGGLMGGGLGMPAPPLLVYFGLQRTAQAIARPAMIMFLWLSLWGIAGMTLASGGFAAGAPTLAAWMLAPMLGGYMLGHWLSARIGQNLFEILTLGVLAATAVGMLVQAVG